jgi:hypothetical protein
MQNEETFIPLESFTVKQRYCPQFGIFYLTRQLFSIQAEGGRWYQKTLFYTFFIFPLCVLALTLDVCTLLLYCVYLIIKKLIQILCAALILLIETVIKKTLGVILLMLSICATLIFIYQKWHQITDFINNLF